MSTDEAERAAVAQSAFRAARPKGSTAPLPPSEPKPHQEPDRPRRGRPPIPKGDAFAVFSECLKLLKPLERTDQKRILDTLVELLG